MTLSREGNPALYLLFVRFSSIQLVRKRTKKKRTILSGRAYREPRMYGVDKLKLYCTGTPVEINPGGGGGANKDVSRISMFVR